jgi:hypothetical protein
VPCLELVPDLFPQVLALAPCNDRRHLSSFV